MGKPIPTDAYAIIIGAMKCGTSSLYTYLSQHPQICPSIAKEPEFFSRNQIHKLPIHKLEELWDFDPSVHRYALEASTGYTKYPSEPGVPKNIRDYGIQPRFIYVIRNPFDRIESHYNFLRGQPYWNLGLLDPHLIQTSNYFLQLEQYRPHFSKESLLLLDFEQLANEPHGTLEAVYGFLNLPPTHFPSSYPVENKTVYYSHVEAFLRRPIVRRLARHLPPSLKQNTQKLLSRLPQPGKRGLTSVEKEYIYDCLKLDMIRLHAEYGFDVRKWGFDI